MKIKEAMTAFACVTGTIIKFQEDCKICKSCDLCEDYLEIICAHRIEVKLQRINLINLKKKQDELNLQ